MADNSTQKTDSNKHKDDFSQSLAEKLKKNLEAKAEEKSPNKASKPLITAINQQKPTDNRHNRGNHPEKKSFFKNKKIIFALFTFVLLLVGIVATVYLTRVNQDIRQQAAGPGDYPGLCRRSSCNSGEHMISPIECGPNCSGPDAVCCRPDNPSSCAELSQAECGYCDCGQNWRTDGCTNYVSGGCGPICHLDADLVAESFNKKGLIDKVIADSNQYCEHCQTCGNDECVTLDNTPTPTQPHDNPSNTPTPYTNNSPTPTPTITNTPTPYTNNSPTPTPTITNTPTPTITGSPTPTNTLTLTPTPTQIPAQCLEIEMLEPDTLQLITDDTTLQEGSMVTFRCTANDPDNIIHHFEFRVLHPESQPGAGDAFVNPIQPISESSNVSQNYTIPTTGRFYAQCRICNGANSCAQWEPWQDL